MGISSSTGLSSGIDYESIISSLRSASSGQITLINKQISKIQTQQTAMQTVNKALLDFKTKAEAVQTRDAFVTMLANSSDTSVMTATATADATAGSYSVKVKQLAQADRRAAQGVDSQDNTSVVNSSGYFSFKLGDGTEKKIAVTSGMNLVQLRDAINADSTTKVKASIVNDGTETNAYRLVLTSSSTGAANAIEITQNDTTLNFETTTIEAAAADADNTFNGTATTSGTYTGTTTRNVVVEMTSGGAVGTAKYKVSLDGGLTWSANDAFTTSTLGSDVTGSLAEGLNLAFTAGTQDFAVGDRISFDAFAPQLQKAQDAIIEVDGVQITRSSNSFADVIPGVTITPKKVDTDTETITISNTNSTAASKIKDLITSYNTLVSTIKTQTAYDTTNKTGAALFGDSGVNGILSNLRSTLTGQITGLSTYNTLSQVGITMSGDGSLAVDSAKLSSAMDKDLEAVVSLFVESGHSSSTDIVYKSSTSDTRIGTHSVQVTQAAEQATLIGSQTIGSSGLAGPETLTIGLGSDAVSITMGAGTTLAQAINQLNTKFSDAGIGITASNDGGKLRFTTTEYGSAQKLTVSSSQAAGTANQFGFGTSLSDTGVDVAGMINGQAAKGEGRTLKLDTGDGKGLKLEITSKVPMSGSITVSRGFSINLLNQIATYTDSESGLFATRETGYTTRTESFENRITEINDRLDSEEETMRAKFTALETKLASLQSQGNALTSFFSSLSSSK